ncbi:MAG: hypothetical protein M1457_01030 [bacterium]|nr:hypothetical protein [bacterium]
MTRRPVEHEDHSRSRSHDDVDAVLAREMAGHRRQQRIIAQVAFPEGFALAGFDGRDPVRGGRQDDLVAPVQVDVGGQGFGRRLEYRFVAPEEQWIHGIGGRRARAAKGKQRQQEPRRAAPPA